MKFNQKTLSLALAASLLSFSACSKGGGGSSAITISGNDQMQFDKKEIKVKAGQKVKLTLKHTGSMKKDVMGHNFVLLKKGTDAAAFSAKAATAKASNYIPTDMKDAVIVSTDVVGGGESTTIEFTAPAAGKYKYLCSFPGHFAMMQGDFIVE